jgi:hypothetical protein
MVILSILPKTYARLQSLAESKKGSRKESHDSIINRLINEHETLQQRIAKKER